MTLKFSVFSTILITQLVPVKNCRRPFSNFLFKIENYFISSELIDFCDCRTKSRDKLSKCLNFIGLSTQIFKILRNFFKILVKLKISSINSSQILQGIITSTSNCDIFVGKPRFFVLFFFLVRKYTKLGFRTFKKKLLRVLAFGNYSEI